MPNWCEVDIRFENEAVFKRVREFVGEDFDFNRLIPYPERFREQDAAYNELDRTDAAAGQAFAAKYGVDKFGHVTDGYNSGGYEWCRENWGTKWPPCEVVWVPDLLLVTFQTPWVCSEPPLIELARRLDITLHVEYFERGMAFCGGFSVVSTRDAEDYEMHPGVKARGWHLRGYRGERGG